MGKIHFLFNLSFLARKNDNVIVVFCGTEWVSRFGWLQFFQWFIQQEIEEVCVKKNLIDRDVVKMEERDFGGNKMLKLEKIKENDVVNIRERDGGLIITEKLDKVIVSLQKWMKLMLRMMVIVCVINVIVISLLL